MVIVQQPTAISFSGNLADIILTDAAPVTLKLFKGLVLILEEVYAPDAAGYITIRLKELIEGLLTVAVPTVDFFSQTEASVSFKAQLNVATEINFKVLKGGVDADVIDADLFSKSNFLTWQPQQKTVKFHDPEWLTYYSNNASVLKAKGYYSATDQTITLANLPAGQLTTVNANYGHLISLFTAQPLYIDIWVELVGVRVSYIQRYILSVEEYEFEDIFVFENSLGGVDTIRLTGEKAVNENFKFASALFDESLLEYDVTPEQIFEKNTGFFRSDRERAWSLEFFKSLQKYFNHNGSLKKILVTKPTLESVSGELTEYKFNFAYSKQSRFLNLARPDVVPPVLEVVGPDQELFFLAPNLNQLPNASFDDSWLLPVQPAFDSSWYKLSIGSLISYMQSNTVILVSAGVIANYYSKPQIEAIFGGLSSMPGYAKNNWDAAYSWSQAADTRYILNQPTLQAGAALHVTSGKFTNTLIIPGVPSMEPGAIWSADSGTSGEPPIPGTGGGASYLRDLLDVQLESEVDGQALVKSGGFWKNQNIITDLSGYYSKTEIQNFFTGGVSISGYSKSNWDAAYGWGNHAGLYKPIGYEPTYAQNSTRLHASDSPYRYGDGAPYYAFLTFNQVNRWRLQVSPATPAGIEVEYADFAPWGGIIGKPTNLSQFTNDLGNYGGWITGINSSMVTGALGYTPVNPLGLGSAAYLNASQSSDGNTVVQRDVNGYIFTSYLNMSAPAVDATAITDIVTTGGDGFLRRNSAVSLRSFLGIPPGGETLQSVATRGNTATHIAVTQELIIPNQPSNTLGAMWSL